MTVYDLAKAAEVPQSLISGLNTNNRVIGEYAARKIGRALDLDGEELESFIYLAINNCTERVLDKYKGCPAEILNLVADLLEKAGITPDCIKSCVRKPESREADAALYLDNGMAALINVEVKYT